ncbi:MAG: hypothetical protein GC189_05645 [Alphaproteobacteria bacterium]|nr:hypothetical protein [Alphaproteobacteria bacterium]
MRRIFATLLALAAMLAGGAAPAFAQRGGDRALELYAEPGFAGERRVVRDDAGNLRDIGFNDRAMSVRVNRGLWLLCDNANFTGRCVTIDRDVANLNEIGLAGRISSARRSEPTGDYAGRRGGLYLYGGPNYQGREVRLAFTEGDLARQGFNDAARSLRTDRPWLVCRDADFQGRCTVVEGDVPNLNAIGLFGAISSARPYDGPEEDLSGGYSPGGPPPGQGFDRPTASGRTASFFARTETPACDTWGAATQTCVQRTADAFCRERGFNTAAYFAVDSSRGRYQTLEDVLCVR